MWQRLGEPLGEVEDRAAEHAAVEVVEPADLFADGRDDLRVRVAEDRAHLPGREVEQLAPVLGEHRAARSACDDLGAERATPAEPHEVVFLGDVVLHGGHATNRRPGASSAHRQVRKPQQDCAMTGATLRGSRLRSNGMG
jgi:hypothetical protein